MLSTKKSKSKRNSAAEMLIAKATAKNKTLIITKNTANCTWLTLYWRHN